MDDLLYDGLLPGQRRKILLLAEVPAPLQSQLLPQSTGYAPGRILGVMNTAA